jgi:tellurite resistance protein TerC
LRKFLVALIGGTIVLFGLALIVLPGPAVIVVPIGLAILASEFAWARSLLKRGEELWGRWRGNRRDKVVRP